MGVPRQVIRSQFHLFTRVDYRPNYAQAFWRATFSEGSTCAECRFCRTQLVSPFVLEWHKGPMEVADFTWPSGLDELVVTDKVKLAFELHEVRGIDFAPVETLLPSYRSKRASQLHARDKEHQEILLWRVIVNSTVTLDIDRSGQEVATCRSCGYRRIIKGNPAVPLVVNKAALATDLFRISECGGIVFALDNVRDLVEGSHFTNVKLMKRGTIH
jgi:DNA-directed RNA polymerase subunit RPC12/RpoP